MKYLPFILLLILGCDSPDVFPDQQLTISDTFFNGRVGISSLRFTTGFKVSLRDSKHKLLDEVIFKYKPYHLDTGDINRDGRTDVLIGLIKKTHFDATERKRLFILQVDNGQLRPLWMGSRVCQELIRFKTIDNGIVQTIERTKSGSFAIGNYEWQGFGLTLIKYVYDEIPYEKASYWFSN